MRKTLKTDVAAKGGLTKWGLVSLVCCVVALLIPSGAEAKDVEIKNGETRGSSITSLFHFDGDKKTTLSTFNGKDSLGDVSGQIIADYTTIGLGGGCGAGVVRFQVDSALGVLSYEKGQLYIGAADTGFGCLNLATREVSLTITYEIVGGSGDFAEAFGELTSTSTGVLLWNYLHPGDDNQFGSFTATYEGFVEYGED